MRSLFDAETCHELRQYQGHTSDLFSLALSPDGHTLATAGHDSTLRLWDINSGQELKNIDCHKPGRADRCFLSGWPFAPLRRPRL